MVKFYFSFSMPPFNLLSFLSKKWLWCKFVYLTLRQWVLRRGTRKEFRRRQHHHPQRSESKRFWYFFKEFRKGKYFLFTILVLWIYFNSTGRWKAILNNIFCLTEEFRKVRRIWREGRKIPNSILFGNDYVSMKVCCFFL